MTHKLGELPPTIMFRKGMDRRTARERRYSTIRKLVGLRSTDRVLDVGCGAGASFEAFNRENEIVGVDLDPVPRIAQDNFRFVHGDAARMHFFQDGEFDFVVCIGVLNRVAPYERLRQATREIERIGRAYAIVVPHVLTFIEPHSQLPLWQFSPQIFRDSLRFRESVRSRRDNGFLGWEGERLFYLRRQDWQVFFPEATILSYEHMPLGLIRNYIIYKRLRAPQTQASQDEPQHSDQPGE